MSVTIHVPVRAARLVAVAVVALAIMVGLGWWSGQARADHQFSDVPNGHAFHSQISWLADSGITAGCGGGGFCPGNPVTRGQMSVFMRRLAGADPGVAPMVDAASLGGVSASAINGQLAALTARLDTLEATVAAQQTTIATQQALLAGVSREWVGGDTLRFSGMNVQIVNGTGTTDGPTNGRGNLIIGYSEQRNPEVPRPGSHYLVIGDRHQWTNHSGIVAGLENTATADLASVLGSQGSTASGAYASVTGGSHNTASAEGASVSGGTFNTASGLYSSVLGGVTKAAALSHGCHPSCL